MAGGDDRNRSRIDNFLVIFRRCYSSRATTIQADVGGWKPDESGNPTGRRRYMISDFGAQARKFGKMALETLVEIMQKGEAEAACCRA
jgi:hypothetical protein